MAVVQGGQPCFVKAARQTGLCYQTPGELKKKKIPFPNAMKEKRGGETGCVGTRGDTCAWLLAERSFAECALMANGNEAPLGALGRLKKGREGG